MKKILVVGATGNLGPHLVKEFVRQGYGVSALLRPDSFRDPAKSDPLKELGVNLILGDLSDNESLKKACEGQDILVSAVGGEQIMLQPNLARIAKKNGVARMIPSEFGLDPHAAGKGSCDLFDAKAEAQTEIKATGIPTTMIYANGFMEFWGTGLGQLGPASPPDTVQFFGDGSVPANMCALPDIARFTAAIIEDENTINTEVVICTNAITQEELIKLWESRSGKKVTRQPVSANDLDIIINGSTAPEDMMTRIFTQLHRSVWLRGDSTKKRDGVKQATELYPKIDVMSPADYFNYFL